MPGPPILISTHQEAAQKDRSASFTAASTHEDQGAIPCFSHGAAFEERALKRRKIADPQRSQSMKAMKGALESTVSQMWEHGDEKHNYHQSPGHQLTTPPDSTKRNKRRPGLSTPKVKTKNQPFQNPGITKPLGPAVKESIRQASTQPVNQYQGFTTTEHRISLAKTTLEKLAGFRYKPSCNDCQNTVPPTSVENASVQEVHLPPNQTLQHGSLCPSSAHESPPSSDSLFNQAIWSTGSGSDFLIANTVQPITAHPTTYEFGTILGHDAVVLQSKNEAEMDITNAIETHSDLAWHKLSVLAQVTEESFSGVTEPLQNERNEESTTNDAIQMNNLLEEVNAKVGKTNLESYHLNGFPTGIRETGLGQVTHGAGGPAGKSNNDPAHSMLIGAAQLFGRPSRRKRSITCGLDPGVVDAIVTSESPKFLPQAVNCQLFDTQSRHDNSGLETSNLDDNQVVTTVLSRKSYASDDFDEGLADDDLLAIASEAAISPTPTHVDKKLNGGLAQILHIPSATDRANTQSISNDSADQSANSAIPSSNIIASEPDEYFMDENDEEELLKLAEPIMNPIERFVPSASVLGAIHINNDSDSEEVYDSSLQFSPPKSRGSGESSGPSNRHNTDNFSAHSLEGRPHLVPAPVIEEEDWSFIRPVEANPFRISSKKFITPALRSASMHSREQTTITPYSPSSAFSIINDIHEYEPIKPFARPAYPKLMRDRCPIVGLSTQSFLRVCFRIGEMYREGARCDALGLNAVIELFARISFSSREPGTTKQHFQFLDLWHDRPPYTTGLLVNYKMTSLLESESKVFLDSEGRKMARCLGRLKRDAKSNMGWLLHIVHIRETDWEEIRWTRRIVSAGDSSRAKASSVVQVEED